jgi:hypothetical protein
MDKNAIAGRAEASGNLKSRRALGIEHECPAYT